MHRRLSIGRLWSLLVVFVSLVLVGFAFHSFVGVDYKEDVPSEATKLATSLFVVAVFLERSTSVFNSLFYGQDRADINVALGGNDPSLRTEAKAALIHLNEKEAVLRSLVGFLLALIVSVAGVRTLESLQTLYQPGRSITPFQMGFYHFADILLTAGLLAGGSNGIRKIIELLKMYVELLMLRVNRLIESIRTDSR